MSSSQCELPNLSESQLPPPSVREEMDHAVMQLKYVTMNPKAPAVFYQCADIAITSK